jgi:catechol 2,3-dioxygenase-like lactoylglutathione lyase family enzyme
MSIRPVPPIVTMGGGRPYQVGIVVPDLEAAMRAYGPPVGAGDVWRVWTYDETVLRQRIYRGEDGSFAMRIALGGSEPQLELVEVLAGPSLYHEWWDRRRGGLHHLAFRVDDARAVIAEMERAGFELLQAGFGFGADGSGAFAYFDTTDALGYIAEAVEAPRERRPPERIWPRPE